jgi:hypothetical protein
MNVNNARKIFKSKYVIMNLKKVILEALKEEDFHFYNPYEHLALEFESTFFQYALNKLPRGFEYKYFPDGLAWVAEDIMNKFGITYKGERRGYMLTTKTQEIKEGFKILRKLMGEKYKDLPKEFYDELVETLKESYIRALSKEDEQTFSNMVDKIYYANPLTDKGKELENIFDNL